MADSVKIEGLFAGGCLGEVQRVVLKDLLKRGLAGPETPAIPQPAKLTIEIKANGLKLGLMWEIIP